MDNVILTPKTFTRGVLMNLGGYLAVARNMSREYSKLFGKAAKVGDSVSAKKPQRFEVTDGLEYRPQSLLDTKVEIKASQVVGVHFDWDGVEKTLAIQDAQDNYFKPASIALAHEVNARAAKFAALNTFNAVGTPGTVPGSLDTFLSAGDKLVELGLPPEEDLYCIVNRKISSKFVSTNADLHNPAGSIGRNYDRGEVSGDPLGYKWRRDQTIYTHTVGPLGGTPLVSGSGQAADGGNNGTMALLTKGWTAAAASRLKQGDIFTIAGLYSVHPQTRQSTGDLQQFVVLADFSSDGSGNGNVTVAPAITPSGQQQNVTGTPNDGDAITVLGAAGTATPQALLMHRNAFACVSVPLATPESGKGVIQSAMETDEETGMSIAMVRFFDGKYRTEGTRFDMLFDFSVLYREMACRIAS